MGGKGGSGGVEIGENWRGPERSEWGQELGVGECRGDLAQGGSLGAPPNLGSVKGGTGELRGSLP